MSPSVNDMVASVAKAQEAPLAGPAPAPTPTPTTAGAKVGQVTPERD